MLSFNTVRKYDVISELTKIRTVNPVCIFGDEEDSDMIHKFSESGLKIKILPGDHHYNKDSKATAETILNDFKYN